MRYELGDEELVRGHDRYLFGDMTDNDSPTPSASLIDGPHLI